MVHDAHDARVGGHLDRVERKAGFLAPHEEHRLADAGADRVHGDEGSADGRAVGGNRLQHEQRHAVRLSSLRVATTSPMTRKLHQSPAATSTASTMPTMAASTGQSFMPAAMRAELPLTMRTVSPTPASTVSSATR